MFRNIALVSVLALSTFAQGIGIKPQKYQYQARGLGGDVYAPYFTDGCLEGSFSLTAAEQESTTGVRSNYVSLFGSLYDWCTFTYGDFSLWGEGITITSTIQKSVRVVGRVDGYRFYYDGSTTPITGSVELELSPLSNPLVALVTYHQGGRFASIHSRTKGWNAPAAVSGTILVGAVDYLADGFASGSGITADVFHTIYGERTIYKYR